VVVPCYNYGRYLPDAVHSALSQDGVDVEVIIVDDASTDDTAAVAHRLASADARISVVIHEDNQGHISTYNDGLSRAAQRYVTLLSADVLIAPGA
ncbi:glycosyltransferase family A protein, partial [Bacillus sp. SIMBA_031]|uniref:glycosyltransferase family 2 protein n=1 Tax=Bacillus sp. SIMBA_031 TaxID=3085774 RepID=UPI00397CC9E8